MPADQKLGVIVSKAKALELLERKFIGHALIESAEREEIDFVSIIFDLIGEHGQAVGITLQERYAYPRRGMEGGRGRIGHAPAAPHIYGIEYNGSVVGTLLFKELQSFGS